MRLDDDLKYFESPEFKDLLATYEAALEAGSSAVTVQSAGRRLLMNSRTSQSITRWSVTTMSVLTKPSLWRCSCTPMP